MARDRLAALRAQQQQGGATSDYPPSEPSYQRRANAPAQRDDRSYEMEEVKTTADLSSALDSDTMAAFYNEISSIQDSLRTFNDNVARISDLHTRSLNNTDDAVAQRSSAELEELVADTSALSNVLKRRIKSLEKQGAAGRDGQIRKQQTGLVKSKFVEAIQNYQTVEQQFRQKYRQRLERQYKIVKPDATPDEIRSAIEGDNGGQVFSQALLNSNRYGESRAAYREVQERHADIQKIEQTLTELAQLFNDMSILVEQQDEVLNVIETTAAAVEKDTEAGLGHTIKAVKSARSARKMRWICFSIVLVILAIVGIVVGVVVSNNAKK